MKRLAMLLCLLTSACATARVTQPWPDDWAPPGEASMPAHLSVSSAPPHEPLFRASPPTLLQLMVAGATAQKGKPSVDQIMNCSGGHTCTLGWLNNGYPDNTGTDPLQYVFGDLNTGFQSYFGGPLQAWAYHGFAIDIGENGVVPGLPTAPAVEDFTLTLHNTSSNIVLKSGTGTGGITLTPGSGGVTLATGTVLSTTRIAPVVTATQTGTTSSQMGIELVQQALTGGAATKNFTVAFSTAPFCVCEDITATAAAKCTTSTTALTLAGTGADVINAICIGPK